MSSTRSNRFANVPLELMFLIEDYLPRCPLSRLCRTSCTPRNIFTPILYSRFTADYTRTTRHVVRVRHILAIHGILTLALKTTPIPVPRTLILGSNVGFEASSSAKCSAASETRGKTPNAYPSPRFWSRPPLVLYPAHHGTIPVLPL